MLLRKRAWDIMNEDFSTIEDSASLAEAVRTLRDSMKETPDNHVVVVKKKNGSSAGLFPSGPCSRRWKNWYSRMKT